MKPIYPTPLAIRFANLLILIKQQIALAVTQDADRQENGEVEGSDRVEKLQDLSERLQLWASLLTVRRPRKESLIGDLLEALEVAKSSLCDQLHGIFSDIADRVLNDGHCCWDSYLRDLDDLIFEISQKYKELQRENVPEPPRQNLVLCFDGGGVASFSSLLILRALMRRIARILEQSAAQDDVLSLMGTDRPRNFFDFIFGSSSGGMIAIMLGRLQMTVEESIESFKGYGNEVFTHARLVHTLQFRFSFLNRPKYGEKPVRKAIESIVQRYEPDPEKKLWRQYVFAAVHDQCRTAVIAIAADGDSSRPHLFRTYDRIGPDIPEPSPYKLGGSNSMPIWEVARAISAVPCYFKIATILDQKFRDAGARFKNPSLEAFAEINAVHRQWQKHTDMLIEREALALGDTTQHQTNQQGKCEAGKDGDPKDAIAVFVSIGSGKCPLPSLRLTKPIPVLKTLKGTHLDTAWEAWWNTEITHEAMEKATGKTDAAYYRFDTAGEGVANLEIDEWKMKTQEGKQVNETLEMIERETNRYLGELETETEIQSCAEMLVRFRRGQL